MNDNEFIESAILESALLKLAIEVAEQEQKIEALALKKANLEKQIADLNAQIKDEENIHAKQAQCLFEKSRKHPNDKAIVFNYGTKILAITKAIDNKRYAEYYQTIPAVEKTNAN